MDLRLNENNLLVGGVVDLSDMTFVKVADSLGLTDLADYEACDSSSDIEDRDDVASLILDILDMSLGFARSYDEGSSRLALAFILECCGCADSVREKDEALLSLGLLPSGSGCMQLILSVLENNGYIHDTKYLTLTEKGKMLLFALRNYIFPCGISATC